jgi:hypothetical protein
MAQNVRRRPLTAGTGFTSGSAHVGFVMGKVTVGFFLQVLGFSSVCITPPALYSYIIWRMNNRPVGGSSSETLSHPIVMNKIDVSLVYLHTWFIKPRFQVLMAASMKLRAFYNVVPCSFVGVDRHFRIANCLHHHPDDGGSTSVWNVGLLQREYTALYPWKLSSLIY